MARCPGVLRTVLSALVFATALTGGGAVAQERAITIVLPEEPDIVDPCHASRSNIGRIVKQNVAETLTEIDPKGTRSERPGGGGCSAVTRWASFGAVGVIRWAHVIAPT
jgi:hypothetical protein